MSKEIPKILQQLVAQWDEVIAALNILKPSALVKPSDGWEIFQPDFDSQNGLINFEIKPAVFNLPERADDIKTELYVVARGRITVSRPATGDKTLLNTHSFATEVGYFRYSGQQLFHVYGAHYDFAHDELGHPAFHAQMKSFCEFSENIFEHFQVHCEVVDNVKGVLKTVRLPTAQMDVFSFYLQLCADHLLYKDSGKQERDAFSALLSKSDSMRGAGFKIPRLATEVARSCYRARHWYPTL
ncbi:hypothetical protein ACO0LD_09160 [Undibacterium sp. Ji83W]|uniref:hypothetical protein n=1 Tax=Undibacterium sp. Ji83W TaxID=3413043 RepID=UPI003BF3749F